MTLLRPAYSGQVLCLRPEMLKMTLLGPILARFWEAPAHKFTNAVCFQTKICTKPSLFRSLPKPGKSSYKGLQHPFMDATALAAFNESFLPGSEPQARNAQNEPPETYSCQALGPRPEMLKMSWFWA